MPLIVALRNLRQETRQRWISRFGTLDPRDDEVDTGQQQSMTRDRSLPPEVLEQAALARSRVVGRDLDALASAIRAAAAQASPAPDASWQDGVAWAVAFITQQGHESVMER